MRNKNILREIDKITEFIKKEFAATPFKKAIVGLSGGIDSSVIAGLCAKALGAENVYGFMLPYKSSSDASLNDAKTVAEHLNISFRIIDITPMVDSYYDNYEKDADPLRKGNRKARERMCVLYDQSAKLNGLVIGTGNKSEWLAGYMTQYGDSASAFEPIGHLYKTEVREMAKIMGLPEVVINKAPTADLWNNQTDEDEIGMTYEILDEIYYRIIESGELREELIADGFKEENIDRALQLYRNSSFKRRMPGSLEEIWDY